MQRPYILDGERLPSRNADHLRHPIAGNHRGEMPLFDVNLGFLNQKTGFLSDPIESLLHVQNQILRFHRLLKDRPKLTDALIDCGNRPRILMDHGEIVGLKFS